MESSKPEEMETKDWLRLQIKRSKLKKKLSSRKEKARQKSDVLGDVDGELLEEERRNNSQR